MPRVHFVKKARKDQPDYDIKKGDSYYWWAMRTAYSSVKRVSKKPPRPSQMTLSEFLSTVYSIGEQLEDVKADDLETTADVEGFIEGLKDELEQLKDETQEKFDNMPEGLQQGDTGQLLESRVESVEEMISELEAVDVDIDEDASKDDRDTQRGHILEALQAISYGGE